MKFRQLLSTVLIVCVMGIGTFSTVHAAGPIPDFIKPLRTTANNEPSVTTCPFMRSYTKAFERKYFIWELERSYCHRENKTSFTRRQCKRLQPCLKWIANNCGGVEGTCSAGEFTPEEEAIFELFPDFF